MSLRLANGESLTVYRLKLWHLAADSALQIEYSPRFDVSDTQAVKALARRVWPVFRRYVDVVQPSRAVLTATNLQQARQFLTVRTIARHFGMVAQRGHDGVWHFARDTAGLPEASTLPQEGILTAAGEALRPSRALIAPP